MSCRTSIVISNKNLEILHNYCIKFGQNREYLINNLIANYFYLIFDDFQNSSKNTCQYQKSDQMYNVIGITFTCENYERLHSLRLAGRKSVSLRSSPI